MVCKMIPKAGSVGGEGAPRKKLPRSSRLRRRGDFLRVYAEGVRARGDTILIVAAPALDSGSARLGLSVGRKYSKLAVLRNRLRRLIREAFRLERHRLPALDLIFIPLKPGKDYSLAELRDEIMTLMPRIQRKLNA